MADAPPPASSSDPPPPAGPDEPLSLGYLSLRQAGPASEEEEASPSPAGPPGDRCRAMMEVVRKDSVAGAGAVGEEGKWKVSKLVAEHNHGLDAAPAGEAAAAPALGMEFDSVHDAKGFYYGYGERAGFKARTGSNRRSAGTGAMIMQRFLCCRGNYSYRKGNKARDSDAAKEVAEGAAGEGEGEGKAGAHKKRGRKPGKKSTPVIELENSVEKGVARAAAGNGQVVPSTKNLGRGGDTKDVAEKDVESVVELEEEHDEVEDATHDGAHDLGDGDGANSDADEDEMEKEVKVKEKRGRGRPRKAVTEGNALQACASTDLGVTASQCAIDERKKILHKYLSKRQSRPSSGRPAKIVSRQALAERRKRGDGGRFLASDGPLPSERRSKRLEKQNLQNEKKPESKEDEIVEAEQDPETEVVAGPGGEPKVGMVFLNEDKAYEFYVSYAGTAGFNVRKGCSEKTANNVTRSRAYVCSKEGFRHKSVTAETKKQRAETRTGCEAHMTVKITTSGKYVVTEYVADHNHDLEAPVVDIQILRSQKLLAKLQQPLDPPKVVLIPNDYKNYIRTRHTKDMQLGDARAISEYLQRMKGQNPSFFYSIQVDEDDQFRNVFWADVKSMMDFNYFGDVVCVDTRYSTSDYCRPLFLFIGVNHHKQPTIFGTAFIYDESVESFKWLFETFKSAMSGNQPRTVLTDSCTTISDAVDAAWPGTAHRFSLLHLYQNATKVLRDTFQGSETFAHDFSRSLYDYEEEGDFLSSWEILLAKYNLKDNEWLSKLYEERERWALPYGRDIFCADIAATLRNDYVDAILTDVLKTEIDLPHFFNRYDKFLEEKRLAEQQADYLGVQMTQRVPPLRLLWQAANTYTPALFEMFRLEFELVLACMVYCCGEIGPISEYEVTVKNRPQVHFVRFDSSEYMVVCSCKKFEFVGLPCCHVLKVLEIKNIKELPPRYILKRWRKDAQSESTKENFGFAAVDEDPKFMVSKRHNSLYRTLYKVAAKAAENIEGQRFMESQYDQLLEQVEILLQAKLHDKPSLSTIMRSQQPNLLQNDTSNSEPRRASSKKNKNVENRRRQQSPLESSKKKKGLVEPEEAELPLGVLAPTISNDIPNHMSTPTNQFLAPSHLMQLYQNRHHMLHSSLVLILFKDFLACPHLGRCRNNHLFIFSNLIYNNHPFIVVLKCTRRPLQISSHCSFLAAILSWATRPRIKASTPSQYGISCDVLSVYARM
ncbi:protein FAR1-RELATED SEQUENCE 12-like isoform X2 [Hordeum vulgare subsp. vulgare]|uniref:protein FAR1-RELATED SEQUENCE 12-like isoform X2 n=1 Tax=Hordeum vulgare subsp. vulgare TaxID=112509 RepID=UPI001D1A4F8A|nr:protein FAR1-RELATED SEQUENCE 12-like isoform X2 [Hordeum vulgare subsp. vulgare]